MRPKIVIPTVLVAIAVLGIAISMQKKPTPIQAVVPVSEASSPAAEPVITPTPPVVETVVAKAPAGSNVVRFQVTKIVIK